MTQTHLKRCSLNAVIFNTSVGVHVTYVNVSSLGFLCGILGMSSFLATCLMGKTETNTAGHVCGWSNMLSRRN